MTIPDPIWAEFTAGRSKRSRANGSLKSFILTTRATVVGVMSGMAS